ncbi:arogenate dehydratase/prephenate dehydratase 6 chloroplastic [Prunus yedoensis var. nudiflora]|uniref:Arogenate dehydratase/prephenate dehydratase 6 chloroplastic n=1 Tax=Prunus yedoensis var. nudiflora TaxID=2094558 RepID=A0A314UFQ3_PRUYE|nr:arogenate dehydratase/prephenate dehydratase 6 chloroplastic [Prunus yedoensis var. nudiflora]
MQALLHPSSNNLKISHVLTRVAPTRFAVVKCAYRSDAVHFHNGIGTSRADWQSSCAILASNVVSQQPHRLPTNPELLTTSRRSTATRPTLTSTSSPSRSSPPPPPRDDKSSSPPPPPRALTITDLSPAPMHGSQLRVAYQGVPAAYSEAAAGKAYPKCEAIPCDQFEVAFQAVELWIADRAVLPLENSLGGSIHRNYDLLLRHRLHIVGEVQLPCELTLTKLGLNVTREAVDDTAGAAEFVAANNLRDTGAIASARAADLYGLEILETGIQDDSSNVTRDLRAVQGPIGLRLRNISLTKIESRPHRNRPIRLVSDSNEGTAKHFEYLFYVDFEASMAEVRAQNALAEVQEFTSFLRVLGSYPMDMTPWSPSRGD